MVRDAIDAIVRILTPSSEIAGTGFLAGAGPWVITCTHVVDAADPHQTGQIRAELRSTGTILNCTVMPSYRSEASKEDVTFLKIDASLRERETCPRVALGSTFRAEQLDLRTFGFPPSRGREGAHGKCDAIGRIPEGGFDALQLRAPEVTYGFSGAPVWDAATQLVVGMVVSIVPPSYMTAGRLDKTAFIRTIEVIRALGNSGSQRDDSKPEDPRDSESVSLELLSGTPYRGLESFVDLDKEFYFGRDEMIKQLISRLDQEPGVLLAGVSGSGKSSLLRAGLAKGLTVWKSPSLAHRQNLVSIPTSEPVASLLGDIERRLDLAPRSLQDLEMSDGRPAAADLAQAIIRERNASSIILTIDQMERLFTDCRSSGDRRRYLELLSMLSELGVKIVIGVRIDFLDVLEQVTYLEPFVRNALFLQQMNEAELREAIEKPAERLGRAVEEEATRALIADVKERPGDLPLLEFALSELWKADNEQGVLTFRSYSALGYYTPTQRVTGAQGAIIKRAEEEWTELQDKSGKTLSIVDFQRLFLKLVQSVVGKGRPQRPSSRRAWLAEFDDESKTYAEFLTRSFLLTSSVDPTGEAAVEVVHEALIRQWSRLSSLIETNAHFISWYSNEFSYAFRDWITRKQSRSALLSGVKLKTAIGWSRRAPDLLIGPAKNYIERSRSRQRSERGALVVFVLLLCLVPLGWVAKNHQIHIARAKELHESGVVSIEEHAYDSAQIQLATSLALQDDLETRQHLLVARANGMQLKDQDVLEGGPIAESNSGKWLVTARKDHDVTVRNPETGSVWGASLQSGQPVTFAVNDAGDALAYGDSSGAVHILRVDAAETNPKTAALGSPSGSGIDSLAFSQDGAYLAVGRFNGQVELWDAIKGVLRNHTQAHRLAVHVVRFVPGRLVIVSGGADRAVEQWDCRETKSAKLGEHEDFVSSIAISPSGEEIASGGADGAVRVWEANALGSEAGNRVQLQAEAPNASHLVATFTGHTGTVSSVAMGDHGLVVSGGEDGTVRLWDTTVGSQVAQFDAGGSVKAVALDPQGDVTSIGTTANKESFVRVWSVNAGQEGFTLYNSGPVATVAVDQSGGEIAAAGQDGKIAVWVLSPDQHKRWRDLPGSSSSAHAVWSLAFVPDGRLLAGGENGVLRIWDLTNESFKELPLRGNSNTAETSLRCPPLGPEDGAAIWSIAIHPSGSIAAVGVASGTKSCIYLVDLNNWREIAEIPHPAASVWSLGFAPKGNLLAAGAGDSRVRIWDVSDMVHPRFRSDEIDVGSEVWGVPFTPDGRLLVTAGLDRHVRLWDVSNLSKIVEVRPNDNESYFATASDHQGLVQSVAVSPNGEWVATASVDRTVKLWNIKTREVLTLSGHDRPAWWVVFSHDGKSIISGGLDRRVVGRSFDGAQHVLKDPVGDLVQEAKDQTCLIMDPKDHVIYGKCKASSQFAAHAHVNVALK